MEEILMGILSKLPVKSLVCFKCVSKFWNTLISHSYLKKQHLIHAKNQLSSQKLLFIKWDPNCHFWPSSLSLVQLVKDTRIFDCPSNSYPENGITGIIAYCSCDGLVLIRIWSDPNAEQSSILVLWNPSTRESVLLPKSSLSSTVDDDIDVGSTYGLPYDSTSDDYKVLEIDMSGHNNNEILSLKNCSWSIIDHKTSGRTDARQHSCLVVNIDHKVAFGFQNSSKTHSLLPSFQHFRVNFKRS
ncbi:putative F-box protein At1g71320 [Capsicum annuum]|uniref:putative F-box protein At1g71320 n=1 Tax=Capsicum annuum TaxID=4072 RepID=UPI001FB12847|nr:putative F-box protein At1g71320 [Capsicum annuum]XP_047263593.1 putative F-box protein At1g71320 [Capsicum annuum]XP_047263594.1 putative F-box protein At1g71320 [Capsicum annuum]